MNTINTDSGDKPSGAAARPLFITPHMLLFLLYNFIYFAPLFAVYLWGYSSDGAGKILSAINNDAMWQITLLYVAGVASFALGTRARDWLHRLLAGRRHLTWRPASFDLRRSEMIAIAGIIILFLALKAALIPLDAYRSYSFDSGAMLTGTWTASMFASEAMLLAGILVLFSREKHNVLLFLLISALNGINLMHGTRVFFIITIMLGIGYAYIKGRLPIWRILLFGPLAFSGVLLATYVIFLIRSSVSPTGAFTVERIVSPVVYESVFSQMSLLTLLRTPSRWSAMGHVFNYFGDVFLFTIPRFMLPSKADLLFQNSFVDLSPLGAFSGYAQGLIYFGLFFPVFYFLLGLIADWLYRQARNSSWWFVLYIYFSADFLFRIMRDGYILPSKMLINIVQIVCALIVWRPLCRLLLGKRPPGASEISLSRAPS